VAELAAYNGLPNPTLILVGQQLSIHGASNALAADAAPISTYTVQSGDTLFQIASRFGLRVARLAEVNGIANVDLIEAGQVLTVPDAAQEIAPAPLPFPFEDISLSETRVAQGRTLVVYVTLSTPADLTAQFEDRPVFLSGDGVNYWGIVGIHALSEVGVYSLAFRATLPDGSQSAVAQNVVVTAGPYGTETINVVPGREGLLDTDVIRAEMAQLKLIWEQVTPYKRWDGAFIYPVADPRVTSPFGTRRSYGGGPINGYHAGTDFGGLGNPIYAPAAGVVVLAERLNVRGNAVLIDHGMGLYSGYWHQSESVVHVDDQLARGDLIGYIGDTGLVTGPHLHWEMRLGGIAVEPLQWVEERIP
jgi:murein DD-endopeptidase MepM/ murein hydrolase activator NlpD